MRSTKISFWVCLLLLAVTLACSFPLPGTPTESVPIKEERGQEPTAIREANQVQVIETPTLKSVKTATVPSTAKFEISPNVPDEQDLHIKKMWVSPDGVLWLATEDAIYYLDEDSHWQQVFSGGVLAVLTSDSGANAGVIKTPPSRWGWLFEPEGSISYFEDQELVPLPRASIHEPALENALGGEWFQGSMTTDPQGRVWFLTISGQLFRFDPQNNEMKLFTPEMLGFPKLEDPEFELTLLTDVVLSSEGQIWVSACTTNGEAIAAGGIQSQDGEQWQSISAAEQECVSDMAAASDGSIWVGSMEALLHYMPTSDSWNQIPLPDYDRPQFVSRVDLDPQGQPWVEITRYGGASAYGSAMVAHLEGEQFLEGEQWVIDMDPGRWIESQVVFTPSGEPWLCLGGAVYRYNGGWSMARDFGDTACQMAADGKGRVWAVGPGRDELWVMDPTP